MSNIYRTLIDLLPKNPLLVGEVSSIDSMQGISTVVFNGSGTMVVRGTLVPVGGRCFVRNGLIEGAAPNLPIVDIEV